MKKRNEDTDKSYVSMEQKVCPCCNKEFDSGALLLDRRLKNSMNRNTTTGFKLCDDCKKEGYVLLIEVNNKEHAETLSPTEANRTGRTVHIKKDVFCEVFEVKDIGEMAYISEPVFNFLEKLKENAKD